MGDISANFSMSEFDCHDGTPVPERYKANVVRLVNEVLQPLRDGLGKKITIISGYRTPAHNRHIDGAKYSQHMKAMGADIKIEGVSRVKANWLIYGFMIARGKGGGVGWYKKSNVHVDIRPTAKVVLWDWT